MAHWFRKTSSSVLKPFVRYLSCGEKLKVALLQMLVSSNKVKNLQKACRMVQDAKNCGAQMAVLPESFNCPYGLEDFQRFSECIPHDVTCKFISKLAKNQQIYIVAGTIPEIGTLPQSGPDTFYNTCTVWDPSGRLIAVYRKLHMFDMDIHNKISFNESCVMTAGYEPVMFEVGSFKAGLGICYDLRFEELAKIYKLRGANLLIYPSAFSEVTGPMHWEVLQRSRALDNSCYVLGCNPAKGCEGYIAHGFSQITDPWGMIMSQAAAQEQIIYAELDPDECAKVEEQIPVFDQRRTDIYNTIEGDK